MLGELSVDDAVGPSLSKDRRSRARRSGGERPVQLFAKRRTPTTAPGIPTPREPVPAGWRPGAFTPAALPATPADEPLRHSAAAPDPAAAAAGRSERGGAPAPTDMLYVLAASGSGDGFTVATIEGPAAASGGVEGWMLLAVHGQRWHWSMPLAGRGAATTAPPRVAQAVAVRVLNDLGVQVRAWHGAGRADQSLYRAELEAPPEPGPAPVRRPRRGATLRPATWRTRLCGPVRNGSRAVRALSRLRGQIWDGSRRVRRPR
jgi:hypothetical protein